MLNTALRRKRMTFAGTVCASPYICYTLLRVLRKILVVADVTIDKGLCNHGQWPELDTDDYAALRLLQKENAIVAISTGSQHQTLKVVVRNR
ncbi:hypothetical protein OUZ56_020706 [Daphnia magna]|uniref:Uncharacterized protein n=1 Tax=Daphnia magna TaxID=35525 RepID=A0ABQ9ZFY0_9CRUS|nr:hypothetical protein OUZ56_020706 [Daphnia magna]